MLLRMYIYVYVYITIENVFYGVIFSTCIGIYIYLDLIYFINTDRNQLYQYKSINKW